MSESTIARLDFLLNGNLISLTKVKTTLTLLDWLRLEQNLCGTKEGCNEGDCGACTVLVSEGKGNDDRVNYRALNACILFLSQLQHKAVRTVEGISLADGTLHPVQQAMSDQHGSQCGFCTPGFVMSMVVMQAQQNFVSRIDDVLAGNLCRCTGYAPIVRAAEAARIMHDNAPQPAWIAEDAEKLKQFSDWQTQLSEDVFTPSDLSDFAHWYKANPDATLIGGATDVGLWVTKRMMDLPKVAFLSGIQVLQEWRIEEDHYWFGAGVNVNRFREVIANDYPDFAEMLRRYGSTQVREAATIGGNIANGSPIGDSPPPLIALGAILHLQCGDTIRTLPIEEFFIDYGKQDRQSGEFVLGIQIPRLQPLSQNTLGVYKISKRFDQDISAVCAAFMVRTVDGLVSEARIAFGGMAATPKRANSLEGALLGQPWSVDTAKQYASLIAQDFTPISDMRAGAEYRLKVAENMLIRYAMAQTCNDKSKSVHLHVLGISA